MIRRSLVVLLGVAIFLVGSIGVAFADELSDHLDRQSEAVYSGDQTVVCDLPDGRRSQVFVVGQNSDGVLVTVDESGTIRTSSSAMATQDLAGQYEVAAKQAGSVLGRTVEVIEVIEGESVRVRLSFDAESSVLLMSEIFNSDGSTYCTTRFVEFSLGNAGPAAGMTGVDQAAVAEVPSVNVDEQLPAELAGFRRIQTTVGPQTDVASAFYGDGVFSFTLLNSPKPISVPELASQPKISIGGRDYQRVFELGRAVYAWHSEMGGYVLVGEIPLDIQERVLEQLPDPQSRGFFRRLWAGLFG